jgi:hypothetical protein
MNDSFFVGRLQRFSNLGSDANRLRKIEAARRQFVLQRRPRHQFENEEANIAWLSVLQAINRRDMRMVQRSQHVRFAFESGQARRIARELRRQDFDSHFPAELGIAGAINLAHAARTERTDYLVMLQTRPRGQGHIGCYCSVHRRHEGAFRRFRARIIDPCSGARTKF